MTRLVLGADGRLCLSADSSEPPCITTTDPMQIRSVSVTQINDFERCPRRWFFKKVRGIEAPERATAGKVIGREIHWLIENYYKRGTMLSHVHAEKARAAVAHLPQPQPEGLLVEHRFSIAPADGLPKFTGVIDLVDVRRPGNVRITDHKTTSKYNDRLAHPVDVANDPQMLTYAEWAFREYAEPHVYVAHNTISTTHVARAHLGEYVEIPRYAALENWERMRETTRNMVGVAGAPPSDWNDVPCNTNACNDYGGCDFLPICALKTPTIGVTMAHDEHAASNLLALLQGTTSVKPSPAPIVIDGETYLNALQSGKNIEPVALLPPDAPNRETPAEEEPAPKPAKKAKAPKFTPPKYEYDVEQMTNQVNVALLNERGADGWELVGFHDGLTAVWRRQIG